MSLMNNDFIYRSGFNQTFGEIYESNTAFIEELTQSPYLSTMLRYYGLNEDVAYLEVVYLLLYSRYGNSSIASSDVNRFKVNLVERLCSFGPTHKKRLALQKTIRELNEEEVRKGALSINNSAQNPNVTVEIGETVDHINAQNQSFIQRSKVDALVYQYNILDKDLNGEFLEVFKPLFSKYITKPILYANYKED